MQSSKMRALVVGLIFLVGLFFSMGKIRYATNPLMRSLFLQHYLAIVKEDTSIDPEKFWEFRDFYAATTSSFAPQNIVTNTPFLTFKTGYFQSADSLLAHPPKITVPMTSDVDTVISQDASSVIYIANKKLYIIFVKPQSEMLRANGFFRYFEVDLAPYKDYLWYNKTIIDL